VHAVAAGQFTGVPAQFPWPSQVSVWVVRRPSSHASVVKTRVQVAVPLVAQRVQAVDSGHITGVPAQAPRPSQVSPNVAASASSQAAVVNAGVQVAVPLGVHSVQAVSDGHVTGLPTQAPAPSQASSEVATAPSSHAVVRKTGRHVGVPSGA
jgi:hypothetical protein